MAGIVKFLMDWIKQALQWFYDIIVTACNVLLTPIAEGLPDLSSEISHIYTWGGFANSWIALDFGFTLLTAWFVCVGLIIGVKWILGLIPTIS